MQKSMDWIMGIPVPRDTFITQLWHLKTREYADGSVWGGGIRARGPRRLLWEMIMKILQS